MLIVSSHITQFNIVSKNPVYTGAWINLSSSPHDHYIFQKSGTVLTHAYSSCCSADSEG